MQKKLQNERLKDEREVKSIYARQIWKRQIQSVFDDRGAGVSGIIHVWSECFLSDRIDVHDLCILQDVFQENISESRRESVVSAERDEGQELVRQ